MNKSFFATGLQTFIEGMLAFISPCILPMFPVYILYLTGGDNTQSNKKQRIVNSIAFVLGFTLLFMLLGASATVLGKTLLKNKILLQRIGGVVIILFGLHFLGVINFKFLNQTKRVDYTPKSATFFSSMLFGAAFSLGWSPCLGPFLGSALAKASSMNSVSEGILLLLIFSMGLGVPFILAAVLYEQMQPVLNWIKKHSKQVSIVSGVLLIITGMAMLFDLIGYYNSLFQ